MGTGLAGFDETTMQELLVRAWEDSGSPDNIHWPGRWVHEGAAPGRDPRPRVIIAGFRTFKDPAFWRDRIERVVERLGDPTIVSGGAPGADRIGEVFAHEQGLPMERFPAWWTTLKKAAGPVRNALMGWRGTHLIALWNGQSHGTKSMIDLAEQAGLKTRVLRPKEA